MLAQNHKKVLLIILDGFGVREDSEFNAIAHAHMPNYQKFKQDYAYTTLDASGTAVGLPAGQFGNSEVGHLNIGAGRVVPQDITRIDAAINDGSFYHNPVLLTVLDNAASGNLHILGLLSDGGVHGHIRHILTLIKLAEANRQIKRVWLHMFLDGRDTPPKSALRYVQQLQAAIASSPKAKLATLGGRYYAMDRDERYNRIELAYTAIAYGKSRCQHHATDISKLLNDEYALGHSDEFIPPYVIDDYPGLENNDSIIHSNFRSDRALQLTDTFVNPAFKQFELKPVTLANFVSMTNYGNRLNTYVAFVNQKPYNTLGEYIAHLGLHQLRIAETEKYPHVTFFFNGGRMEPFINEERVLIPSPRDVATYDLKPEMSLAEVSGKLIAAIKTGRYDFIITNFANGDMVGHSGNFAAAIKAVEALDQALGEVVPVMQSCGGEVLIIADHGNCEEMFDVDNQQPHTQHTTNLVPCLYIGRKATFASNGVLADVAPTLLTISGLPIPPEMTGRNLIVL